MAPAMAEQVTNALTAIREGDPTGAEELLPLLYQELRKLAHDRLAHESPQRTLQTTALVHEAYLRLVGSDGSGSHWENRAHFFAAAARAMRRILVEHARQRGCLKHGAGWGHVSLDDCPPKTGPDPCDLLTLDELLTQLESIDKRKSDVVQLRYFAGMTVEETATALQLSTRTVQQEWRFARAWLYRRMSKGDTSARQNGKP